MQYFRCFKESLFHEVYKLIGNWDLALTHSTAEFTGSRMGKAQCKYLCNAEKPCQLTLTKCLSFRASLTFKGNDAIWNPNLCSLCS